MIRGMTAGNEVRYFAAYTRGLVEEARQIHGTNPIATAALGRTLTAGAMMGAMCKNETDVLTLQIKGDGPLGGITVTADSRGNVKGYVNNPEVLVHAKPNGKLDVSGAVGNGILTVIKDLGLKEPYSGQVDLQTGEIAEDLTYYFAESEQIPSAVGLGVLLNKENTVRQAGGFIIQVMPDAAEETIARLEKNISLLPPVTSILEEVHTPEGLLDVVLSGVDHQIQERYETRFYCNCSKERVEKALISIGKKELASLIAEKKPAQLHCHFCNTDYEFSVSELEEILKKGIK